MNFKNYVHSLQLEGQVGQRPEPKPRLTLSEVMTIIIHHRLAQQVKANLRAVGIAKGTDAIWSNLWCG
ncbi:MAG: hypothetical protein CSA11_01740 [Chloroflexi bacterium]|nr:MAG: hypothetical protein CSA11_01740 [Chloroflexota bacterium]